MLNEKIKETILPLLQVCISMSSGYGLMVSNTGYMLRYFCQRYKCFKKFEFHSQIPAFPAGIVKVCQTKYFCGAFESWDEVLESRSMQRNKKGNIGLVNWTNRPQKSALSS